MRSWAILLLTASCSHRIDVDPINELVPASLRNSLQFVSMETEAGVAHEVRYRVAMPRGWNVSGGGADESTEHGSSNMWVHSSCDEPPCKPRDWNAWVDRYLEELHKVVGTVEHDERGDHRRVVIGRQSIYDLRSLLVASWHDGDAEIDICEVNLSPRFEAALPAFQKACEAAVRLDQ